MTTFPERRRAGGQRGSRTFLSRRLSPRVAPPCYGDTFELAPGKFCAPNGIGRVVLLRHAPANVPRARATHCKPAAGTADAPHDQRRLACTHQIQPSVLLASWSADLAELK